jgi:hypothetical protein
MHHPMELMEAHGKLAPLLFASFACRVKLNGIIFEGSDFDLHPAVRDDEAFASICFAIRAFKIHNFLNKSTNSGYIKRILVLKGI